MPDYPNRILRDDLLAQLRAAKSPRTAAELRRRAPRVPSAGVAVLLAPLHEQVYRALCGLHRDGLVTRAPTQSRQIAWAAAPNPTADREIADLEAVFAESAPIQIGE